MRRGGVFIGDVLDLIQKLRPDEAALRALLPLVGVAPPSEIGGVRRPDYREGKVTDLPASRTTLAEGQQQQRHRGGGVPAARSYRIVRVNRASSPVPAWLSARERLSEQPFMEVKQPDSLFEPSAERAILTLAASTLSPDGMTDFRMLIQTISSGRPVTQIPRALAPTVRRGVQVLIDRGDEMVPFDLDCDALVERIRAVVGRSQTRELTFVGTPQEPTWAPPAAGTAIVLVTALGASGPLINPDRATTDDWVRFARRAQTAGCPLVALSPHPASRYPPALRNAISMIHWDRPTSARATQKVILHRGSQ